MGPHPDCGEIRARVWFGHREAGGPRALDRRQQVLLALVLGGLVQDHVGLTTEVERHERPSQLRPDQALGEIGELGTAVGGGRPQAPEPKIARLALQRLQLAVLEPGFSPLLAAQQLRLERHHLSLDERADGIADSPLLIAKRKVQFALSHARGPTHLRRRATGVDASLCSIRLTTLVAIHTNIVSAQMEPRANPATQQSRPWRSPQSV